MSNAQDVRHILVIEDQKSKRIVALKENTYTIGRDPNATIILYDRQVSRHHATLLRITDYQSQHSIYRIIDGNLQGKKSTNGVLVNGKYTLSHELKPGDLIRFGSTSRASYHVISTASEVNLLKVGDPEEKFKETITNLESAQLSKGEISMKLEEVDPEQLPLFNNDITDILPEPPLSPVISSIALDVEPKKPELESLQEPVEKNTIIFQKPKEKEPINAEESFERAALTEFSPNPIIEINYDGEIIYINQAATLKFPDLTERKSEHPLLKGLINKSIDWGTEQVPDEREKKSWVREIKFNDEYFEQSIYISNENRSIRSYIFEVTKYKNLETQLQTNEERYSFLVQKTSEGIFIIDAQTKQIIEANAAVCQLLGYQYKEIIDINIYQIIALDREIIDTEIQQLSESSSLTDESLYRCQDGSLISVEATISRGYYRGKEIFCFSLRDISERKRSEEKMQYQAFHDPLTNLPNRNLFNKQLSLALANAKKNQTLLAVMFLDLDSFKNINNTLGHNIGDRLLQNFAQRLMSCTRAGDTVARWGGDNFTILIPRIKNTEETVKLSQKIFEDLKQPFIIEEHQLTVKVSIGIALYPQDGEDEQTLLKNADVALARTKEQGRNNYQFYTPLMSSQAALLLKLETALYKALDRREFSLYYQPQVKISTGEVTAMEALLRWEVPEIGFIPPSKFFPQAEKTDIILQIGQWVLQTACDQNLAWQDAGLPPIPIAVNLSGREFQQTNLVEIVARILQKTGLDPQWLELEVTEKIMRQNLRSARQIFQDFHNLGIRLALDDFGRGFSSIGYLKQFTFRTLKIDQTFMRDLRGSSQDSAIIAAALTLGQGFNLRVVAEGVETQSQLELLKSLHCQEIQGYLFSRPLRASEATQFLTKYSSLTK